jgi:hypothetical protein
VLLGLLTLVVGLGVFPQIAIGVRRAATDLLLEAAQVEAGLAP